MYLREPREHHLGEVLQGRFPLSKLFKNKNLIAKFLASIFQNISIGNFQPS